MKLGAHNLPRAIALGLLSCTLLCALWPHRKLSDLEANPKARDASELGALQTSIRANVVMPEPHVRSALEERLAAIGAEPDPDRRSELFQEWVDSLPATEIEPTIESLAGTRDPGARELLELLIGRLAQQSPAAAANWLARFPQNFNQREAMVQVAAAWADSDLTGALEWSATLPKPQENASLLTIAYEAARTYPITALDVACMLPPSADRDNLLAFAVTQWAFSDAAAATQWAEHVPDAGLRQQILAGIAIGSAKVDPADAAALTATALEPGEDQARAAVAVVQRWAQMAPEEAAAWVAEFPDTLARREALQSLIGLWASRDLSAATTWLESLPAGPLRAEGFEALEKRADAGPKAVN